MVEKELAEDPYRTFYETYKTAKNEKKPKLPWYGLCSEIRNLRMLARHLSMESHYALVYPMLSDTTHASDVFAGALRKTEPKKLQIHQIRGPVDAVKRLALISSNYLLMSNRTVCETFLRADGELRTKYLRWYERLRPYYRFVYQASPADKAESK